VRPGAFGVWTFVGIVLLLAGCSAGVPRQGRSEPAAQLFEGLGTHHRPVTTSSPLAQRYFDQGLIWSYAFNHDEAIRSFGEAARLDPGCAMAFWGIALCNGPHINNPTVPPERSRAAWEALNQARALKAGAGEVEQALIEALSARYADPPPADRRRLDEAYAAAMERVHRRFPDDADVAVLFAEALMDLQPWDLWTPAGQPKGATPHILSVLEKALVLSPSHPGACHLYIHAVEAGPHPEKADAAADVLRTAVPLAGHLVHMPAHIDVQRGRWALAADQNRAAIQADRRYRALSPRHGFYHVYMAHNHHFLAFAAMMEGDRGSALQAARDMIAGVPDDFLRQQPALIDPYMMIELDVLKRFGRWDDILARPRPPTNLPITTAFWHYARGIALAAKGRVPEARREQQTFRAAAAKVPADAVMAINPAHRVLAVAEQVLAGEIALAERRFDEAIASLRQAVRLEDDLLYMEPPEWIQPARHTLGAVLIAAGRHAEAETVYREDLQRWPENGWSLQGLARCLRARHADAEASRVEARFRKAWSRADTSIATSCLCVRDETGS